MTFCILANPPEQKPVPSAAARNPCPAARDTALLSTHAFINSIYTVKRSQDCGPQSFHRPRHNTIREEVVVEGVPARKGAQGCKRFWGVVNDCIGGGGWGWCGSRVADRLQRPKSLGSRSSTGARLRGPT